MSVAANIVEVAALVGDTARATMLAALMEGRSLTGGELAWIAGVSKSTASGHLTKLVGARLLAVSPQGRHCYYRIGSPLVAQMLESIGVVAAFEVPARFQPRSSRDARMNLARTCYDHLAGRLGVSIADALVDRAYITLDEDGGDVSPAGVAFLADFGLDCERLGGLQRRIFCRPCLDATERRVHLAGRLGKAIASRCFELGWLVQAPGTRVVEITRKGSLGLKASFAFDMREAQRPGATSSPPDLHDWPVPLRA